MHELSIVIGILDASKKEAEKHNAKKVESIELDIGTMAGIEFDALNFAWEMAEKDLVFAKSKLIINKIEARAKCINCGYVFDTESAFSKCEKCGEMFTEILSGKELRIKALTLE